MNPTNDPLLRSFVPVDPASPFPIQNLPYGSFRRRAGWAAAVGVAIGDQVLDLTALEARGLLNVPALGGEHVFQSGKLNLFLVAGRTAWSEMRRRISRLLHVDEPELRNNAALR